jgi:hypothetical protein
MASSVKTQIPDLSDIRLDEFDELNLPDTLRNSIALYRERLKKNGEPLSSFNARI